MVYAGLPASTWASVLFPEPFGPMMACTSPARTVRSTPRRISYAAFWLNKLKLVGTDPLCVVGRPLAGLEAVAVARRGGAPARPCSDQHHRGHDHECHHRLRG